MTYIDEIVHPLDIRGIDTDPALVDLQPYKDDAHADRLQRERRQAERKREYLRTRYEGQGEIKTTIKAPRKPDILMVTGNRKLSDPAEIIQNHIEEVTYDLRQETDIDVKMSLLDDLTHARELLEMEA